MNDQIDYDEEWARHKMELFESADYAGRYKILGELAVRGFKDLEEQLIEENCTDCLGSGMYEEIFSIDDIREVRCHCSPKVEA